ncbi:MAG: nuclear transport factor 2 family protein [Acidobacteriia bacterium]|nr:nuclear transport factor 2 family protein [Terriglobia bacterium]
MIYVLLILGVGAAGGYLLSQKVDEWRAKREAARVEVVKQEDLTQTARGLLDREKEAFQSHDADQLLNNCASDYTEVNGNSGESMDLARARIYYHDYFRDGQAVKLEFSNIQVRTAPNALIADADFMKTSNAYTQKNIQSYKGHGVWIFVRQNADWRLASFAWSETAF